MKKDLAFIYPWMITIFVTISLTAIVNDVVSMYAEINYFLVSIFSVTVMLFCGLFFKDWLIGLSGLVWVIIGLAINGIYKVVTGQFISDEINNVVYMSSMIFPAFLVICIIGIVLFKSDKKSDTPQT